MSGRDCEYAGENRKRNKPSHKKEFINQFSGWCWITVYWMLLCLRQFVPQKMNSGGFWLMACLAVPVRWKSRASMELLLKPRQNRDPRGVCVQHMPLCNSRDTCADLCTWLQNKIPSKNASNQDDDKFTEWWIKVLLRSYSCSLSSGHRQGPSIWISPLLSFSL